MSNVGEELDKKLFAIETMIRQEANRATGAEKKLAAQLRDCASDIETIESRLNSHGTGEAILGKLVREMRHGWQLRRSHPNPRGAELWTVLMGGYDCYGATPEDALRAAKEHK